MSTRTPWSPRRPTRATEEFRAARDLLLATRHDHDEACRRFRWPRLATFNWALEWFDVVAGGEDRIALELVRSDGTAERTTYREMARRSDAVAAWLNGAGVRRGDRVLVVLGTQRELWECLLACIKLGAVAIPGCTSLTPAEAQDRVRRGGVRHVVARSELAALFTDSPRGLRVAVGGTVPGWAEYSTAFRPGRPFVPTAPTPADELAFGYFTSGTTSLPKLVGHTHTSYPVGHLSSMYWNGLMPGDRHLNVAAPGWAKHLWSGFFVPWNAEATIVACPDGTPPERLPAVLAERRVTSFCAPPSIWQALRPHLRGAAVALREATSAGEPLDPALAREVRAAWGIAVRDGYGQTETTAMIGTSPGLTPRPGWLGKPLPGYRLAGEPGSGWDEIRIDLAHRPAGLMRGYLGDPAQTAAAVAGGCYHTGDVGLVDASGWVRVGGRRDDVFKSFGHRVSPYELEAVLRTHPDVAEVAIVAQPHPVGGAVAHAVVVPRDDRASAGLVGRLLAHVDERVASALRVHAVHLTDRLPRTRSGKVRRSEVGEWLARAARDAGPADGSPGLSDALSSATARLLALVAGLSPEAAREPSLLPEWSRGHLLTHLARNADGLRNLVAWAVTGVRTPMYDPPERRAADIAAGAHRVPDELARDVAESARRLGDALSAMPPDAAARRVLLADGRPLRGDGITWHRLKEVEIHAVDLGLGATAERWEPWFVRRALAEVVARCDAAGGPAVRLRITDVPDPADVTLGAPSPGEAVPMVTGPGRAVLAWLLGRPPGPLLTRGGGPLPPPPPTGPPPTSPPAVAETAG